MLSAPSRRRSASLPLTLLLALAACEPAHREDDPAGRAGEEASPIAGQLVPDASGLVDAASVDAAVPGSTGGTTRALTVVKAGSRRGLVRASAGSLSCTGTACTGAFAAGTRVTLTAEPYPGGAFSGWLGACSGIGPCTVELTADVTVTADFTGGPNIAFITSKEVGVNFANFGAADGFCNTSAQAAGLPGRYVAFLYDAKGTHPSARLAGSRGWVRPDGMVVADAPEELRAGPRFPLRLDELGADHVSASLQREENGAALAWTGSDLDGITRFNGKYPADVGTGAFTCDGWSQTRADRYGGLGAGGASGREFSEHSLDTCNQQHRLFCFGVGNQAEVVPPQSAGRLAFVTRTNWVPGGGLAAADRACQSEARAAGRGGSFRALLATTTGSAASRFDSTKAPWVRPDGTPVTVRGDSLQTEDIPFVTPPLLDASGQPLVGLTGYWLGARSLRAAGTAADTCGDWSTASAKEYGLGGLYPSSIAPYSAFGTYRDPCSAILPHPLLCLQE